jgi:hypothetical protein
VQGRRVCAARWVAHPRPDRRGFSQPPTFTPRIIRPPKAIRADLARFGITRINFASLNNPFPATQVMSLPYVFGSTKARASCCGWSCRETSARGIREARLIGLAIYDSGARCWWRAGRCARQVLNNSPGRTEPVALLLMSVADLRRGLQRCRADYRPHRILSRRARGPARRHIRSDAVAVAAVVAAGGGLAANPPGRSASLKSLSPDGGNTASTWHPRSGPSCNPDRGASLVSHCICAGALPARALFAQDPVKKRLDFRGGRQVRRGELQNLQSYKLARGQRPRWRLQRERWLTAAPPAHPTSVPDTCTPSRNWANRGPAGVRRRRPATPDP